MGVEDYDKNQGWLMPSKTLKRFMGLGHMKLAQMTDKQKLIYWREKAKYYEGMYNMQIRANNRMKERIKFMKIHPMSTGTRYKKDLKRGELWKQNKEMERKNEQRQIKTN
ncbi:MAG: hypothetical protein ACYSTX_06575 [Planctomycetota bacterium]|jgi:hypothetical protein